MESLSLKVFKNQGREEMVQSSTAARECSKTNLHTATSAQHRDSTTRTLH
ncbi:hypothetical protein CIB84_013606 [Bambusicola thoracicus]|uniref:Uncharacterized protein n=1 Tax=Bambusicola thoracicus TaxID=9083 RepID=A0A2P4SF01_BAMTH|nr:hypothetical protein CIB84_013606 [Bambusicola thoracicus]